MPPVTFCNIGVQPAGNKRESHVETSVYLSHRQFAATLLAYMWLRQEEFCYIIGTIEPHINLVLPYDCNMYQLVEATMGGWHQAEYLSVRKSREILS